MKTLRPYQREAIDAIYNAWKQKIVSGIVVIPTAGGKSLIMATLIQEILSKWPDTRILSLTHVKELIDQNQKELGCGGIFSAGLGKKDLHAKVLFASIQSIEKHIHKLLPPPEIVIIDEAHLISRKENTRYYKAILLLRKMYPNLRVLGFSATPYRLDSGWLHHGEDALFQKIIYEVGPQKLIDDGYLSNLTTKAGSLTINTKDIGHLGGEFKSGELERRAMDGDTTKRAVSDIIIRASDRKKWLIYACGIDHCYEIEKYLSPHISCAVITGKSSDRDDLIHKFKNDEIKCLINCDVLTTGFNHPPIDCIIMLRPTESPGLYVQIIGRGMRISEGKKDCLILDYAGNVTRHGPIDLIDPSKKPSNGDGLAPCKECPECQSIIAAGYKECPDCGYLFPPPEKDISHVPGDAAILKSQIEPKEIEVNKVIFSHYKKQTGDTIKIEYKSFLTSICEWKKPDPTSYYYRTFCHELGLNYYPVTVEDFLNAPAKPPKKIYVIPKGKFYEVTKRMC